MNRPENHEAKLKAAEEFFAKFLYMADHQRYRKIIKDMENAIIQKKDPFPKDVSEACRLLNGWQNNYVQKQKMEWPSLLCLRAKRNLKDRKVKRDDLL